MAVSYSLFRRRRFTLSVNNERRFAKQKRLGVVDYTYSLVIVLIINNVGISSFKFENNTPIFANINSPQSFSNAGRVFLQPRP